MGNYLSVNNWVVKDNILNQLQAEQLSLSELRFFSIYLSKINPNDPKSAEVEFSLDEYCAILNIQRINNWRLDNMSKSLLSKVIELNEYSDGQLVKREYVHLYRKFTLNKDLKTGDIRIKIVCSDEIMSHLFELKKYFFKYQLWNTLCLSSKSQVRMYEILKQNEFKKNCVIKMDELKGYLGTPTGSYQVYSNFRLRVLEPCRKELLAKTDIGFNYKPIRMGRGGKVVAISFDIFENKNYQQSLALDNLFPKGQLVEPIEPFSVEKSIDELEKELYADACEHQFTENEMNLISFQLTRIVPYETEEYATLIRRTDVLHSKYMEFKIKKDSGSIKHEFAYFKKILESMITENN